MRMGRRKAGNSLSGQAPGLRRNPRTPGQTKDGMPTGAASPAGAANQQPPVAQGLPEHAGAVSQSLVGGELFLWRINAHTCSLIRRLPLPVDRANQAAAKTVRGQPCRLARPRPSGAPGGQPPDPCDAPHPLRYPLVPPFFPKTNSQRRRWPVKNLFSKARSLAALTLSKKVLDRHPSALAKTIPSMRKKGGSKNRTPHTQQPRCHLARTSILDKQVFLAWLEWGHFYRGKDGDISNGA